MTSPSLPSYREATTPPDWLELVAPYVAFSDYASLCRVCRRSWALFAPRLWSNLLVSVRRSGLDANDDVAWWLDFAFRRLSHVAPATRALVRLLDATDFAKQTHFCQDHGLLQQAFQQAIALLPNLCCLVVVVQLDASWTLCSLPSWATVRLRLLSVAHCPGPLSASMLSLPTLQSLVYIDVSSLPGSVAPFLQPRLFPHVRVLKARAREIGNGTLEALVCRFTMQLWSLDVSENKLTDDATKTLCNWCICPVPLSGAAHFDVEGELELVPHDAPPCPWLFSIRESEASGSFSHAQRHLVDSPLYAPGVARWDGASPVRSDTVDAAAHALALDETDAHLQAWCQSRGLTHVHLSRTHISSFGIQDLLRMSRGRLEHLDCDSMTLLPTVCCKLWPVSASLYGMLGSSHLFRPVWSSNLHTLRIHHSLVTQVPTLQADDFSALARLFLAETVILPRVQAAYGEDGFMPNMNPRLTSLTLTCIPRRSTGPLISSLIKFMQLLSLEERAMYDASVASSWRSAGVVTGLRHLRLEFEADPMQDGFLAEELMQQDEQAFSFFHGEQEAPVRRAGHSSPSSHSSSMPGRDTPHDHVMCDVEWNGQTFPVAVWIGAPDGARDAQASSLVRQYRRLALEDKVRDAVGPATQAQILAGVPKGSLLFQKAWCATVMPPEFDTPRPVELAAMRDVLGELKAYRASARAQYQALGHARRPGKPHCFWTGRLEVVTGPNVTHQTYFWR